MHYCNTCAAKNNYPTSFVKSMGKCEICGIRALCNSVASKHLPKQVKEGKTLNKLIDKAVLLCNDDLMSLRSAIVHEQLRREKIPELRE